MSHFTTIKTVIRDQVLLCDTLRHLHHRFREGERVPIGGCQVVVDTGCNYDIGFQRQADGTFIILADWWAIQKHTTIRETEFLRQVHETYARLAGRCHAVLWVNPGYIIEEERVMANGEIQMLVTEPA